MISSKKSIMGILFFSFVSGFSNPVFAQMQKDEKMQQTKPAALMEIKKEYNDRSYLSAMIVHHNAAINMANAELNNVQDKQVKKWAKQIVKNQEPEIKLMRERLDELGGEDRKATLEMRTSMQAMMIVTSNMDADSRFLSMMIIHHAEAVDMAVKAVLQSDDQGIIELSQNIINTQIGEIIAYRRWLADREKKQAD